MRKIMFFHATWCKPCGFLERNFISLAEKVCPGQIERIDVEIRPSFAEKLKVVRVPTLIFIDEEREVFRRSMLLEPERLISWLKGKNDDID